MLSAAGCQELSCVLCYIPRAVLVDMYFFSYNGPLIGMLSKIKTQIPPVISCNAAGHSFLLAFNLGHLPLESEANYPCSSCFGEHAVRGCVCVCTHIPVRGVFLEENRSSSLCTVIEDQN